MNLDPRIWVGLFALEKNILSIDKEKCYGAFCFSGVLAFLSSATKGVFKGSCHNSSFFCIHVNHTFYFSLPRELLFSFL